jgi:hypothetical protein
MNMVLDEIGNRAIGAAGTHNFGGVHGTKKSFFYFLARNSPVQPLLSGFNMQPKQNDLVSAEYNHLQMIFYKLGKIYAT